MKWKEWGSVRASQSGAQELHVPMDRAAPGPGLAEALLHFFLLPGHHFSCPTASSELLALSSPGPFFTLLHRGHSTQWRNSPLQPCRLLG